MRRRRTTERERIEEARRGTRTARGYSNRWLRASALYRKLNPLCVACLARGIPTPATCVDHLVPHRGNSQLFWDEANWQSLCDRCHSAKTMAEVRGRRGVPPSARGSRAGQLSEDVAVPRGGNFVAWGVAGTAPPGERTFSPKRSG